MFGGVGLYLDGLFFALIDDDTLYFKADEASRRRYEAAGSRPFCPDPSRPEQAMGYWQVPADVLEDPEALVDWAREAQGVALSKRGKRVTRRRSPAARRVSRR
jgi:DNA transformation protein